MDRKKRLALIFVPVGMVLSILSNILNYDLLSEAFLENTMVIVITISMISVIASTLAIVSILRNRKFVVLGIILIMFSSVIGGVFYFVWQEEKPVFTNSESVASVKWICPKCHSENYYNHICDCGYVKEETTFKQNDRVCSKCGFENSDDANYCSNCGNKL